MPNIRRIADRHQGPEMARLGCSERGRAIPLCPGKSDVDLFGYCESIVDFNAQIAHRALNLLVPQQKLNCPQVASAAVDECRLGSAQRVRPEEARVQPNAGDPLTDQ